MQVLTDCIVYQLRIDTDLRRVAAAQKLLSIHYRESFREILSKILGRKKLYYMKFFTYFEKEGKLSAFQYFLFYNLSELFRKQMKKVKCDSFSLDAEDLDSLPSLANMPSIFGTDFWVKLSCNNKFLNE